MGGNCCPNDWSCRARASISTTLPAGACPETAGRCCMKVPVSVTAAEGMACGVSGTGLGSEACCAGVEECAGAEGGAATAAAPVSSSAAVFTSSTATVVAAGLFTEWHKLAPTEGALLGTGVPRRRRNVERSPSSSSSCACFGRAGGAGP
eukprot:1546719-Pyramimonas_sp.AAC.2